MPLPPLYPEDLQRRLARERCQRRVPAPRKLRSRYAALGKPADRDDARRMLTLLSGRVHRVLTGVWLRAAADLRVRQQPVDAAESVEESLLEMGPLSNGLLEWYLDSGMWQGKAGACGFQDERLPLHLVSGSGSNVVGLPLERVRAMLAELDRRSV